MARPRSHFKHADGETIQRNLFEENPEGLPPIDETPVAQKIVITQKIPEMRRFMFINGRDPGVALLFHYHSKTHPLKHYTLFHGKEHELPLEVIEHLENCGRPHYAYKNGENGHPEMYVKSMDYMFQCKPVKRVA